MSLETTFVHEMHESHEMIHWIASARQLSLREMIELIAYNRICSCFFVHFVDQTRCSR
jgi:hypothetical protein